MKTITQLVIIGASAFPEVLELIRDINLKDEKYDVLEVLDDDASIIGTTIEGYKIAGGLELVHTYSKKVQFVFAIGSHRSRVMRYSILKRLNLPNKRYETLVHPNAKIYSSSKIGDGVIIHIGTVIFNNSTIGSFCIIVANSIIGARNILGNGCLITSLVSLTADVKIGAYSFIGTQSSVAEGIEIGPGSMVGMRTLVSRNLSPGVVVFGNPMKIVDKIEVPFTIVEEWEKQKKEFAI